MTLTLPGACGLIGGLCCAKQVYVRNKVAACEKCGIRSVTTALPEDVTQEQAQHPPRLPPWRQLRGKF